MIGIIDYKAGNAPSVLNALCKLNVQAKLVSSPQELDSLAGLILPGVGSAQATMQSLKKLNLIGKLEQLVVGDKIPFLGICIGLQVLFDYSEEGNTRCLGLLKGQVKRFSKQVRIPQIGWNEVEFIREHPIKDGLEYQGHYYFVNSYYVVPDETSVVLAETDYDIRFCSMAVAGNIMAAQFHIEKSGVLGLKLLQNFSAIVGGQKC